MKLIGCILLLLANAAFACPQVDCVRVGSWNIEWLGSSKRPQSADKSTIDAMVALVADELSIDVIAFQEINTELSGKVRGESYSLAPWQHLRDALGRRGYQMATGASGNAQRIVLAWRQPVTALTAPHDMAVDDSYTINPYCRSKQLRKPLLGKFRAKKFDFWLAGFHLKASTGAPAACTTAIRTAQLQQVAETLPGLQKTERDLVFVGDFNAGSKHESLATLRDNGFVSLTDNSPVTHPVGMVKKSAVRKYRIDHIMVMPQQNSEWLHGGSGIYTPPDSSVFKATFSDHVPVWADFSTLRDDD